ncbi:MAG: carbamoyl-phosphate synthase large subunit [Alphaproteobacteria bacterium]
MAKRNDIKTILVIGAGPIVIGQACEFDYSGTQACKALKEEGYRVILVNSNPATIMTDPNICDATYIEPITVDFVTKIIEKERPDAILPTMGGQTSLNCAMDLADSGVLEKYNVELIGAKRDVIEKAESRDKFRAAMNKISLDMPRSALAHSMDEALAVIEEVGLPAIIRPSFTLGGKGGGVAYNMDEYRDIIATGLDASPVSEVLVEESIIGWKEFEMEVVRDKSDNCIIICSIENLDPMGIHTGDSITVAPALTLTDKEYQIMRDASFAVLREIGVETGGSNVQFAINPKNGRMIVIEMNPRVSRSSALASKATGFPIARVAAKLAVGYTLDELQNEITKVTPASFEPTIDYIVTKIPRFTFEKFPGAVPLLSTAMKSVGEAMAIGRSFKESIQKALRSMETGICGFNEVEMENVKSAEDKEAIYAQLAKPVPMRILHVAQAFRYGLSVDEIYEITAIDPWFLTQIKEIVEAEEQLSLRGVPAKQAELFKLKQMGFSDKRISQLTTKSTMEVRYRRQTLDVHPVFHRVDTCAAEFDSPTAYMYSSYEGNGYLPAVCESEPSNRKKIAILGGGPNRIGQGIEFDYCCVHASWALQEAGYETIMVNCNPETVSTDFDTSDRLYFEPLTVEDTIELLRTESSNGALVGIIVQFGGQTPLKLASALEDAGFPILGTTVDAIDLAEDRERFQSLLKKLELTQPENGTARSESEAIEVARQIGYPLVIRPSYVLGGRAMEIVTDEEHLLRYMHTAVQVSGKSPVLLDRYLQGAIEVDVDAISDGKDIYVAGIMEHVEEAGIHSGDSACSLPPVSFSQDILEELDRQTRLLAQGLNVVGLMNIQFAIKDDVIYILEVNPRASRTVPFVAKATSIPVAHIAARVMAGEGLASFNLGERHKPLDYVAIKEAVFPFNRFAGVDPVLGPEMRSTGEVMGIAPTFADAFLRAQIATNQKLPDNGCVFISVKDDDKAAIVHIARQFEDNGFSLAATPGTAKYFIDAGLNVTSLKKLSMGRPNCVDAIKSNQVQLVINTGSGSKSVQDGSAIRKAALDRNIPYYTTVAGAKAAASAISFVKKNKLDVCSLQDYFS